jgi:predicted lipoprotein
MKKAFFIAIAIGSSIMFYACSKTPVDSTPVENGFDKTAMLTYYADSAIMPGYATLVQRVESLEAASDEFLAVPSIATQATLKDAYKAAYLQYQQVAAFQFGPAETALLDLYVNFSGGLDYSFTTAGELTGFSVDTVSIENNISSGNYNFATMSRSSFYSQGFPALGYLFFAQGAIEKYSTNTASRVSYTKAVTARLKTLATTVAADWNTYRATFIANTQTNVGSPIGNMVNQLAYQMDLLKGPRIGWPLGKQSNGIVFATKCEAYYAGFSVALAIENLTALKKLYVGGNGRGLSGYLVALGNESLNNDVLSQFDNALSKLKLIPDPLSTSLVSQPQSVDAAYKEIQKLLTLLKTDVASATAVQITFMDNDGD